jgi:FAD/FMN-containing dehydrogenase
LFPEEAETEETEPVDVMANIEKRAIDALRADAKLIAKIESTDGAAWGSIKAFFLDQLPEHLDDRDTLAFRLVKKALDHFYGPQDQGWEQYRHPTRNTAYVRKRS